ncbi:MAG: DUF4271 domain-containing protein [Bacteroidetes bacterium]|jgi:hypothetical protein|nr:DUF4271 domain-containing protein [Bacteroidota bacterium]
MFVSKVFQDSIPVKPVYDSVPDKKPIQDTLISIETDTLREIPASDTISNNVQPSLSEPITPSATVAIQPKEDVPPIKAKDSIPSEYRYEPAYHTIYNIPVRKIRPGKDSTFNGQTMQQSAKVIEPVYRSKNMEGISVQWFNLTLYAIVILSYIWLQFFNKKYVIEFLKSTFNFQLGSKLYRDRNLLIKRILFVLNLIYYISISLFALQTIEYYQIQLHSSRILSFILIAGIITGIVQLKRLILIMTGKLFLVDTILHEYIFNTHLVNKITGLALIPVTVFITYLELGITHLLVFFGLSIIILSTILKFIKGLKIILRYNLYLYNIILYLCTLEILPIFIGIRIFVNISL